MFFTSSFNLLLVSRMYSDKVFMAVFAWRCTFVEYCTFQSRLSFRSCSFKLDVFKASAPMECVP